MLLNNFPRLLSSDDGLAPRARRDITAAVEAGRFEVADIDVAVAISAGALIGQLLHDQQDRDVEQTTDLMTEDLLRMFGVPRRHAHRICTRPLPGPDAITATVPPLDRAASIDFASRDPAHIAYLMQFHEAGLSALLCATGGP